MFETRTEYETLRTQVVERGVPSNSTGDSYLSGLYSVFLKYENKKSSGYNARFRYVVPFKINHISKKFRDKEERVAL
jgi:hypothetical protein